MQAIKRLFIQQSQVFKRYLLSYLLVCLLPLSIFFCVVYSLFVQSYQNEVLKNAMVQMSQTRLTVDNQLEQINNTANQVFTNKKLKPFSFSHDNLAGQTAREELTNYLAANNFIKEMILYPGADEYLFSSTSSYTMDRYIEMNQYASVDIETFNQWMTSSQNAWVRPAEDVILNTGTNIIRSRYVLFLFPDPIYRGEKARKLLVVVEEQRFKELIQPRNDLNIRHGILLDKQDNVIIATDPDISICSLLSQISEDAQETALSIQIDGHEMIVLYQRSATTGWKYLLLIDRAEALQIVYSIRTMLIVSLLTVFVLGIGLTVVPATVHSYKPVQDLAAATAGITTLPRGQDEFEYVRQGIDHLHNRNLSLTNEMENSSIAIREYLLYYLLKGQIPSVEYFNEKGSRNGLSFRYESYGIVIFYASSMIDQKDITTLGNEVEKCLSPDLIGFARSHNESNHLLVICNFRSEQYYLFVQTIEKCRSWLAEVLQRPVTAGYSAPCMTIDKLPNAYIEALTALDYRFIKGQNNAIAFSECTVGQSIIDQSLQNIPEKLTILIENGDQESIENLLSNVRQYIKKSKPSIFVCKMVCFDIINTVWRYTNQHLTRDQIREYPNVFMIASFETFDELVDIIKQVSSDLVNVIRINQTENSVRVIDKMRGYIHEHCSDCGFSIKQMADDFGVSASALSQYFKEHQGSTVLEYTAKLRMEKAKSLLRSTHIPLQDVALEVGYYNVASFIRRFKQIVGCTPGEYRIRKT